MNEALQETQNAVFIHNRAMVPFDTTLYHALYSAHPPHIA
jgi:hypothetical protein